MASAAVLSALETEGLAEVDQILSIELALIDLGPRLRAVDEVWALALGELMLREGQRDPVDIARNPATQRFEVHGKGGHRWTGAGLVGIEHLQVRIHAWNPDAARLREIADNLHRRDLDPFDRALFVAEAVACLKRMKGIDPAKDGRAASANVRWQKQLQQDAADTTATFAVAYGWSQEVGDQLGLSERSVRDLLMLARRLPTVLVDRLRAVRHPVLSNAAQLRAMAKLDEEQQTSVVTQLIGDASHAPAKSVSEALSRMRGANRQPSNPSDKRHSAFIGGFARMGLIEKKGALHELAALMPKGFHLLTPSEAGAFSEALGAAFKVLTSVLDGEPVSDDEAHDAAAKVQQAMIDLDQVSNAGADE
jgi:hypothetical protein